MKTHVGHGIEPLAGGRIDLGKVAWFQTGEEVFFDVADGIFHAPLFLRLPRGSNSYLGNQSGYVGGQR